MLFGNFIFHSGGAKNTYSHVHYDGLGRKDWQSQIVPYEVNEPDKVLEHQKKKFAYDAAGRLIETSLANPDVNDLCDTYYSYYYDGYGNQVAILDPCDRMTVFEYDHLSRRTAKYMPFVFSDPTPGDGEITIDDIYNATAAASPDAEYRQYDDQFDRLKKSTDYKGQITGYEYDLQGRLEYKKYYANYSLYDANDPNETVRYTYDNLGRKETVTDSRGTTTYHYDAEGRIIAIDTPEGTINYEYDSITGRKIRTYSTNTNVEYFYDELGRLAEVSTADESAVYEYDEAGNRDYIELDLDGSAGYEIKTDYTYDSLNRLTHLIHQKTGPHKLADYSYTLKADGMRHSLDESANEDRSITYTYDNLNRLTEETADSIGDGYTANYEYDLVGNRTKREIVVNAQTLTTDYVYYTGTDKLQKEIHTGPVYSFVGGNERYYAYADGDKLLYYRDLHGNKIGPVKAFFTGLPSVWNRYVFIFAMALVPILLFGPAVLSFLRKQESRFLRLWIPHPLLNKHRGRLVRNDNRPTKLRPHIPRKGICLLIAFVMLFGPEHFHSLSQADMQYANLSTATWAQGDTTIEYTYDANGSVETKITTVTSTTDVIETVTNEYNLQNRLAKVTTEDENGDKHIVEYAYNDDGIKVKAYSYDIPYGGGIQGEKKATYLTDPYNHTGYAQTLERVTISYMVPEPVTVTTTYLIGDDVLAQTDNSENTRYLLCDGHGSTRQLAEYDTDVTIADSYSYDAYGVMLQDNSVASADPGKAPAQATSLLYTGEHFDSDAQQYYLRARWYDSSTGLFNRMDDYAGNRQDPQSLHKYLYCHANPVNATDPSGLEMSLAGLVIVSSIIGALVGGLIGGIDSVLGGGSFWSGFGWGALFGAIAGAAAVFLPMTLLVKAVLGGIVIASTAIGAFSSFMSGHHLQGFFRILIGLVSLGLLIKAPTGPSLRVRVGHIRSLQNLGFTAAEAKALAFGKPIVSTIANPGGEDTLIITQFVNGRLRVGILSIEDTSGTGARAFGAFRTFAYNIARTFGVKKVDMFGARIRNPKVESMLIRQGFKPKHWTMHVTEEGLQEYAVYVKTVEVP